MALESILNAVKGSNVSLISGTNGAFNFDADPVHQHASKLRLTDNPVESGATITDHAVLEPKEITINGIMVSYTPPSGGLTSKITSYPLVDYLLPIEVKTMAAEVENAVDKISSTFEAVASQANQIAADFLPSFTAFPFNSSPSDRVAGGYESLLDLQRSGELLTIETGLKQYKNMMITSVAVTQKTKNYAEFSIVLRELFIVETKTGSGLKSNMGVTQPSKIEKGSDSESALGSIFGG